MELKAGQIWKHYKGGIYRIIALASNSESDDFIDMVVYQKTTDDHKTWVQSVSRFMETVHVDGKTVPRFELISEN